MRWFSWLWVTRRQWRMYMATFTELVAKIDELDVKVAEIATALTNMPRFDEVAAGAAVDSMNTAIATINTALATVTPAPTPTP